MAKSLKIKDLLDPNKAREHIPEFTDFLEEGGAWQVLMGLSNKALEDLYATGYNQYQEGLFDEAITTFTTLTILNPYDVRYWTALGSSQYLNKQYEEAANAYLLAGAIEEESPEPKFQAALCFEALNRVEKALQSYEEAFHLTNDEDSLALLIEGRIATLQSKKSTS